tara:strand:- start:338 stop:940 length:603 start_codon:yes stop_codon:yes gene_type:complete
MKKTYLNTYGKYVEISPKLKNNIKTIIEKHISLTDKEILDIGCGTGNMGFHIGSLVKTFTGIDPNENYIKIANKNKINFNKNLIFKVGSFENIPLNKKFDIVIANNSFHFSKNKDLALKTVHNFLKKGGYFFIFEPNKNSNWGSDKLNRNSENFDEKIFNQKMIDLKDSYMAIKKQNTFLLVDEFERKNRQLIFILKKVQ